MRQRGLGSGPLPESPTDHGSRFQFGRRASRSGARTPTPVAGPPRPGSAGGACARNHAPSYTTTSVPHAHRPAGPRPAGGGIALFLRGIQIAAQHGVDGRFERVQARRHPHSGLARRRDRAVQCLTRRAPMHPALIGQPSNREALDSAESDRYNPTPPPNQWDQNRPSYLGQIRLSRPPMRR